MSTTVSYTRTNRAGHVEREAVPKTKRMGRPTDFEPEMIALAAAMARVGATDEEITEELGISSATFYRWFNEMPDFREAVRSAKDGPDERVKRSLFRDALAGSQTAQIFWLKNRKRADWNVPNDVNIVVPIADAEQLDAPSADVRSLALAAIALIREAPEAPTIEEETRHANRTPQPAPAQHPGAPEEAWGVRREQHDHAREDGEGAALEEAARPRRSRRGPARAFDL